MVLTATGYVPIEAGMAPSTPSPAGLTRGSMPPRGADEGLQKYSPDQPRVPAGNADGGQWTSGSKDDASGDSSGSSNANDGTEPNSITQPVRYAALDTGTRTDAATAAPNIANAPSQDNGTGDQYAAITVERYDRTGDERVDRTSDILFQVMVRDEELVDRALILFGKIGPALYGTVVHLAFAADVKWQDMPGIGSDGVEQSFSLGDVVHYGTNGSIRTDVVLRDDSDNIVAVWDLKTGNAQLTDARVREIRAELKSSNDVPVFMLHIGRGIIRKRKVLVRSSQ